MAAKRDLPEIARDFVMAALDGIAERAGNTDATPGPVQQVAERWTSMSKDERDNIAKYVAVGVQSALTALPLVAAAASKRVRRTVKRKTVVAAEVVADEADKAKKSKKDKKDKKRKKKDKKKNKKKK